MCPIEIGADPPPELPHIVQIFDAAVAALYEMHQRQDGGIVANAEEQASGDTDDVPD